jgi:hypothetical protein
MEVVAERAWVRGEVENLLEAVSQQPFTVLS